MRINKVWLILVLCFFYSIIARPGGGDSIKISKTELRIINGIIASYEVEIAKNTKLLEIIKADSLSISKRDSVISTYTALNNHQKVVVNNLRGQLKVEKRKRKLITYILGGIIIGLTGLTIVK